MDASLCHRNHAWVSFQEFDESFNDTFSVPKEIGKVLEFNIYFFKLVFYIMYSELSPHIVGEAFYSGEVEAELRRIGHVDYRFRYNSDRESCMEMTEKTRGKNI